MIRKKDLLKRIEKLEHDLEFTRNSFNMYKSALSNDIQNIVHTNLNETNEIKENIDTIFKLINPICEQHAEQELTKTTDLLGDLLKDLFQSTNPKKKATDKKVSEKKENKTTKTQSKNKKEGK